MTRRHLSDHYDPELTREDMGRPTRQEIAREEADRGQWVPAPVECGDCGVCLACAMRGRRAS